MNEKHEIIIPVMRDIEKRKELKKKWESIHPVDRPECYPQPRIEFE